MRVSFSLKELIMWRSVKEREVNESEALQIHMSPAVTLRSIFRRESLQNNQNKSSTQHISAIFMFETKGVGACVNDHIIYVRFTRFDFSCMYAYVLNSWRLYWKQEGLQLYQSVAYCFRQTETGFSSRPFELRLQVSHSFWDKVQPQAEFLIQ